MAKRVLSVEEAVHLFPRLFNVAFGTIHLKVQNSRVVGIEIIRETFRIPEILDQLMQSDIGEERHARLIVHPKAPGKDKGEKEPPAK